MTLDLDGARVLGETGSGREATGAMLGSGGKSFCTVTHTRGGGAQPPVSNIHQLHDQFPALVSSGLDTRQAIRQIQS